MITTIIIAMVLSLAITLYNVHTLSKREEELLDQINKLNREIWDLQTENLSIRSQIQAANDRAKTWELHANDLIQSRKNAQSSGRKGND